MGCCLESGLINGLIIKVFLLLVFGVYICGCVCLLLLYGLSGRLGLYLCLLKSQQ